MSGDNKPINQFCFALTLVPKSSSSSSPQGTLARKQKWTEVPSIYQGYISSLQPLTRHAARVTRRKSTVSSHLDPENAVKTWTPRHLPLPHPHCIKDVHATSRSLGIHHAGGTDDLGSPRLLLFSNGWRICDWIDKNRRRWAARRSRCLAVLPLTT